MFVFDKKRGKAMRARNTDVESKILEFVNAYIEKNSICPSYREISVGVGLSSTASIHNHVKRLEQEGKIDINGRRGVSTRRHRMSIQQVPVVGQVACGTPILAEENIEEYVPILKGELGTGEFFALRARGDSMIKAGIEDGELVFVRRQDTAEEGDIVVALIDDAATLKRFYKDKRRHKIILRPENDAYDDMEFDDIVIQGKAVKVLKNL